MLVREEPVPTGLITALLARSRVRSLSVTEVIGPSPRQMRELTEGRGLFSPYKLNRVAALTGVPERRIRAALEGLPELIRALKLRKGREATHARLGPVRIVEADGEVTIETPDGRLIAGVHPASFAGPDLLDRFGLSPEPPVGVAAVPTSGGAPTGLTGEPPRPADLVEPAKAPEPDPVTPPRAELEYAMIPELKETILMKPDAAPEPDLSPVTAGLETDRRDRLRALIARSGRSQADLSREIGKDPSFLSAILTRGRRMPEDLFDRLAPLCHATGGSPARQVSAPPSAEAPVPQGPEEGAEATGPFSKMPDAGLTWPVGDQVLVLRPTPPGPDAPMIEVLLGGGCRVRVPEGFDMEAAARLIRSLSVWLRPAA